MTHSSRRSSIDLVTREAAAWFARLRADDVSEQDRARFDGWLAADPKHRDAYASFERFWSTTGSYAGDPKLARAVHEAAAAAPPPAPRPATPVVIQNNRFNRRRMFAMAASVAMAVFAGSYLLVWPSSDAYETAVGEQRSVALADGSRLTLNTNTRVRVRYNDDKRTVRLDRGQAYFRVAKDSLRPFEVETRSGLVRAIGTAFDVYENGSEIVVTVTEGTVLVTDPSSKDETLPVSEAGVASNSAHKILRANQRLALASVRQLPAAQVTTAETEKSTAWLNGKLIFDNEPLGRAIGEINRYSGKRVILGDDKLKSLHLSGVFRTGEPDDFVASISGYFALRVEPDADGNYVLHARQ